MISKKLAAKVLNTALATGGDFAEIFTEKSVSKSINTENGKVETNGSNVETGAGIRILKNLQSVYGHTNDMSEKSLVALADRLSKSFDGKQTVSVDGFKVQRIKKVNKPIRSYAEVTDEEVIALLKKTYKTISSYDKRIVKVNVSFACIIRDIEIFNSDGKIFRDHKERSRVGMKSVASENGKIETRFDGPGTQKGFEYYTTDIDIDAKAKHNAEKCILMLGAKECPAGKFPVVIGNGWGGVIFHEACGHQLEATSVSKKLSVYYGLQGQKIGNSIVTAYDDGTIPNEWGSNNIDDEGYPTQKNLLIKNGILMNYLVDPFGARRMDGAKPTGCSRRQSYRFEPTSRMSNTYIANGKSTKEEIIAATKLGIYAVSFGGGSVDPSTGEFNFGCSEAYLIKDGKICEPLRGATLIGKATEILNHIDMIANDLDLGQGMCGSVSGSIPTNVGQPTIRVDEITVGGRGGDINEL